MKRMSLTTRMSLMFMLAVTAVLTVAGLSFNSLSRHHFKMLDQQALNEKLHSTQRILTGLSSIDQFSDVKPELEALLGAHRDLIALIFDGHGKTLLLIQVQSIFLKTFARPQTTTFGSGVMMSKRSGE